MAGFSFGTPNTTAATLSFNTTSSTTPGFSFGNTNLNAASTTPGTGFGGAPTTGGFGLGTSGGGLTMGKPVSSTTQNPAISFKPGGLTFGTPAQTQPPSFGFGGSTFGAAPAPTAFGSTTASTTQPTNLSFGNAQPTNLNLGSSSASTEQTANLSFGNMQAGTGQSTNFGFGSMAQPNNLSFGSTSTNMVQPNNLGFGSTQVGTTQPANLSLGSTPTNMAQPNNLGFGSTQVSKTQPANLNFGSTLASTAQSGTLSFGSTPAPIQTISFGAPATTQTLGLGTQTVTTQQGLSFGTPSTTQTTLAFGTTPATSAAPLMFSSLQPTTQATAGLSFGTPTTTQNTLSFGLGTPATTASAGFPLGTPTTGASLLFGQQTKPLSFGLTPTTTTAVPTTLFPAPKTTATTGFSLSVSSAGMGTSLAAPTTAATPATTVSASPAPFKGLGGVDTSTTFGTGQKDIKTAKENQVNPEILATLDPFKNFVKQQKNLGCEVSRAPVKPMHKVTEDTEALNKLLTSVSNALQKNRVVANKLKADTTKCLQLCEMAQRTHDTPLGLQNDNVAPLEFFMALVAKFELDIQALRQEIDNTEKHVNSLSYPAILNPQELSVALRRLHDSFVALSGRLQLAHSAVVAQKERHLGLRRHLLKDSSNVFETAARVPRAPMCSALPLPGPTPFSSMGGFHNMNLIAGQDRQKSVTFSSGPSPLAGWGTQTNYNLTQSTSIYQSQGLNLLSSSQPVDNQSFQLGKPPVGNKRGKR